MKVVSGSQEWFRLRVAEFYRERAALCFRLAKGSADIEQMKLLQDLGKRFEEQADIIERRSELLL